MRIYHVWAGEGGDVNRNGSQRQPGETSPRSNPKSSKDYQKSHAGQKKYDSKS